MEHELTRGQLCKETGYSPRRINELLAKGLPHVKSKGVKGRIRYQYNLKEATDWMIQQGLIPPKLKVEAEKEIVKKERENAGKKSSDPIDRELAREVGFLGAVERLKIQEFKTSVRLAQMVQEGEINPTAIMVMRRLHSQQITSLRAGEFSALEYRERIGEYCRYKDMVMAWERVTLAFKNAVLGIPTLTAPMIRKYLKNPNDIEKVRKVLDDNARNVLAQIPATCPESSDIESLESGGSTTRNGG